MVHAGDPGLFSPAAIHLLEAANDVRLSPMVVLELQYLYEVERIAYGGREIAGFLEAQFGFTVDREGLGESILSALSFSWTRDPFDRLITAQAARLEAPLLTRDRKIREHYARAVW